MRQAWSRRAEATPGTYHPEPLRSEFSARKDFVTVAGNGARLAKRGTRDGCCRDADVLKQLALGLQKVDRERDRAASTDARNARDRRNVLDREPVRETTEGHVLDPSADVAGASAAAPATSALGSKTWPSVVSRTGSRSSTFRRSRAFRASVEA